MDNFGSKNKSYVYLSGEHFITIVTERFTYLSDETHRVTVFLTDQDISYSLRHFVCWWITLWYLFSTGKGEDILANWSTVSFNYFSTSMFGNRLTFSRYWFFWQGVFCSAIARMILNSPFYCIGSKYGESNVYPETINDSCHISTSCWTLVANSLRQK